MKDIGKAICINTVGKQVWQITKLRKFYRIAIDGEIIFSADTLELIKNRYNELINRRK